MPAAVRFDASGEHFTRALNLGSQANFTLCGWMKIVVDRNTYGAFGELQATSGGMHINLAADGTSLTIWDDAGAGDMTTDIPLVVGNWYFVAMSVAGTSGLLYARTTDGTVTTRTWTSAARTLTTLWLGSNEYGEWLNGSIAAAKLYTAGLTQAELAAEAGQYNPVRTANLQGAWIHPDYVATADYSGNARTLSGGTGSATDTGPGIPVSSGTTLTPARVAPLSVVHPPSLTAVGAPTPTWVGDFETGDFSQWLVQNKSHNDPGSTYVQTYSATIQNTNVAEGSYAARFEVRDGDTAAGSNERSEVQGPYPDSGAAPGEERWYSWYTKFDPQFPANHSKGGGWLLSGMILRLAARHLSAGMSM